MNARTLTAQMSMGSGGAWRLYVVVLGEPDWPTYRWDFFHAVPSVAQRRTALTSLGYEPVSGGEWSWTEDSLVPDDDTTTPVLIAAINVQAREEVSV
ncbi:hypothetical protein GCM10010372_59780 [Streptomyces tauricus]|uniref:DUF6303 family protein n=1 Tax=Streptomyces tauricus TaxID=68274 RepID=UPI00167818EC|nr:DUF6303 family protein [Streptomyces tauricus]GHA51939.1 hypothetical protein GCM10010372_59780 [Streptomyces tauricus]